MTPIDFTRRGFFGTLFAVPLAKVIASLSPAELEALPLEADGSAYTRMEGYSICLLNSADEEITGCLPISPNDDPPAVMFPQHGGGVEVAVAHRIYLPKELVEQLGIVHIDTPLPGGRAHRLCDADISLDFDNGGLISWSAI